jgi:serine-type anaerobic sulfatase-maturating enzyme
MASDFQVFLKPAGSRCNLACDYCYYRDKDSLFPASLSPCMDESVLEAVIVQHRDVSPGPEIQFSWHGGEPTVLGLDYFRRIVELQRQLIPPDRTVLNGIQTNGTLLDEEWARFLSEESFYVGISLDGPREIHDTFRRGRDRLSSFEKTMHGLSLLKRFGVGHEILCVVSAANDGHPLAVYRFFKDLGVSFISLLPLVEPPESMFQERSVTAERWGDFLCVIFDEWKREDIGKVKIQIFEEAMRPAIGLDHILCIFKKTCGRVPVIESNGDFFSCDHFVDEDHRLENILENPLGTLMESPAQLSFGRAKWETLPRYCRECEVLESCFGGCPKNRFLHTPDGEPGLNALCAGYQHFFIHCRTFVNQVAELWKKQRTRRPGFPGDI